VAQAYVSESPHPMILAMTASPGAERKKIEELCRALFIEHVEMRSEEDPDVQPYVGKIGLEWKILPFPQSYREIYQKIKEMLENRLTSLASMGVIKKHPKFIFRNDLLEAGEKLRRMLASAHGPERGKIFGAILLQSSAMTLYHALELLESQGLHTFASFLEKLRKSGKRSHRWIGKEMERAGSFQKREEKEEHPKIKILESEVRQQLLANPSSKVIIFTQYRDTSSWIVERLRKLGIWAERFVGQADREEERGMSQDEQARLLEKFREGKVRVLVATSIAEEGLDIPNVDLVVFYEPVPSEIRYIQRKGRTGRGKFGRVVILATENSLDTTYLRSSRKKVERMRRMIKRLNMELSPIMRFGPRPPLDPMTPEEIAEAEKLAPPEEMGREDFEELEDLKLKEFNREVNRAARKLLTTVLKSGREGVQVEELEKEMPPAIVRAATERLLSSNLVEEIDGKILPAVIGGEKWPESKLHTFEVEKILPGMAILLVDEKWRAILTPDSYEGPRDLLKKGMRFRAAADLYKREGRLHARVWGIESVLS
ncbi:MAG: helicase-related protein, partial [Candidatus Hadarchaeales archaeon]